MVSCLRYGVGAVRNDSMMIIEIHLEKGGTQRRWGMMFEIIWGVRYIDNGCFFCKIGFEHFLPLNLMFQ